MHLSTGLYYYFSFCQVVHRCIYFPFLAIQYPNTRLLADELLTFSASSSPDRTRMSQLPRQWRNTGQLFSIRGKTSGNHLKGADLIQVKERASHCVQIHNLKKVKITFLKNVSPLSGCRSFNNWTRKPSALMASMSNPQKPLLDQAFGFRWLNGLCFTDQPFSMSSVKHTCDRVSQIKDI